MIFIAMVGWAHSPGTALVLFAFGAFMHQMLACMLVTLTPDLFEPKIVGAAGGLAGLFSWLGGLLFTAVLGALVDKTGYTAMFVSLLALDLAGIGVLWVLLPTRPRPLD